MYFSAGTSGIIHTAVVAASLFSLPALELAFGDRFGRGEQEVVDLLVELGADLNVADYEGRTAVSWAASNGHSEIVKKLLENGARPGVIDNEGLTPLMRAAWNGHENIVRLLIGAGAPISGQDDAGNSALD